MYVCRYISEQKATFGTEATRRGAARHGCGLGTGTGTSRGGARGTRTGQHTQAHAVTHTRSQRHVRVYRTNGRANRPTRRILIIMKGETLFVGQELNL